MADVRAVDDGGIAAAARALAEGRLVGLPTETVYGLAADATSGAAVARIYAAKGRPSFNPLIAHVLDIHAAEEEGVIDTRAQRMAFAFWPGPLTLVVPARAEGQVSLLARAGLDTVALRVPAHPVARAVLEAFGRPVAAPSANRSGHVSATLPAHVVADLGDAVDLVLDAGPSPGGLESSIVGVVGREVTLLRAGAIPHADLERALGAPIARRAATADISAPGQLASHYAPSADVRLDADAPRPGEAYLAFGPTAATGPLVLNLSASGDLIEAAANLFAHLRALDGMRPTGIAVAPIPGEGLGEAIRDRLARAAVGR